MLRRTRGYDVWVGAPARRRVLRVGVPRTALRRSRGLTDHRIFAEKPRTTWRPVAVTRTVPAMRRPLVQRGSTQVQVAMPFAKECPRTCSSERPPSRRTAPWRR